MKLVPRFNDGRLIQHADDQVNDGSELGGEPHEVVGYPIGDSVESYQGYLTVEVYREGVLLYGEQLCEKLKVISFMAIVGRNTWLVFRLRTAWSSTNFADVDAYVYAARCEQAQAP